MNLVYLNFSLDVNVLYSIYFTDPHTIRHLSILNTFNSL